MSTASTTLKERLRSDLTAAIRGRDKVRSGTIRMVLSAITEAEVAGPAAVELSDQQVLDVVIREAKKRREAEEAFVAAGRDELQKIVGALGGKATSRTRKADLIDQILELTGVSPAAEDQEQPSTDEASEPEASTRPGST